MKYLLFFCLLIGCQNREISKLKSTINWQLAFTSINEKEATSFNLNNPKQINIPAGRNSYHQQGIQRLKDGGWAVSGSGQEKGYIYFTDQGGILQTVYTIPDDLNFEDSTAKLKYNHPGGFQITNNILAIGLENTDHRKASYSRIVLLDISNPTSPQHLSHLDIIREVEEDKVMTAGAVAITELQDAYLIIVGNWDSKRLDFYKTSGKDLANKSTTMSACLGSWVAGKNAKPYQNINVYGGTIENLYLIGMYSKKRKDDFADLFYLDASDWTTIRLERKAEKQFSGGVEKAHFVHGSGTTFDFHQKRFWIYSIEANRNNGMARCNSWE